VFLFDIYVVGGGVVFTAVVFVLAAVTAVVFVGATVVAVAAFVFVFVELVNVLHVRYLLVFCIKPQHK